MNNGAGAGAGALAMIPLEVMNLICEYISHLNDSKWSLCVDVATGAMKRVVNKYSTKHVSLMNTFVFKQQNPKTEIVILLYNRNSNHYSSKYMRAEMTVLSRIEHEVCPCYDCIESCYLRCYDYEDTKMRYPEIIMQYTTDVSFDARSPRISEKVCGQAIVNKNYETRYEVTTVTKWRPMYEQDLPWDPVADLPYDLLIYIY